MPLAWYNDFDHIGYDVTEQLRIDVGGTNILGSNTVGYYNYPGMTNEMVDGIYRGSFANLPGATLKRIDDSAHFIMFDHPALFAAEVNAFLE